MTDFFCDKYPTKYFLGSVDTFYNKGCIRIIKGYTGLVCNPCLIGSEANRRMQSGRWVPYPAGVCIFIG
jgi:hypothetical protein